LQHDNIFEEKKLLFLTKFKKIVKKTALFWEFHQLFMYGNPVIWRWQYLNNGGTGRHGIKRQLIGMVLYYIATELSGGQNISVKLSPVGR
jgi:hypothetical protein